MGLSSSATPGVTLGVKSGFKVGCNVSGVTSGATIGSLSGITSDVTSGVESVVTPGVTSGVTSGVSIGVIGCLRKTLVLLGFLWSVSYIKSFPSHEKLFAVGKKSAPNATFNPIFLGSGWPWVGDVGS